MSVIKMSINQAKSQFFDRNVVSATERAEMKVLSRFGSYVRRTAKSSLRKARQKKIAELTSEEKQRFRISQEIAKRENLPKPKRPLASSKPGEPPRMRVGLIKKFLFFSYDRIKSSVVIGPAIINRSTGAPETLEYSGSVISRGKRVRVAARPFMNPAHEDELRKHMPGMWKDSIR